MILCFGCSATMQPVTVDSLAHDPFIPPPIHPIELFCFALRLVSKDIEKEIELIKSWNVFNFTFQKWFVICWLVRFYSLNSVKTLLSVSNEVVVISETLITRTFSLMTSSFKLSLLVVVFNLKVFQRPKREQKKNNTFDRSN